MRFNYVYLLVLLVITIIITKTTATTSQFHKTTKNNVLGLHGIDDIAQRDDTGPFLIKGDLLPLPDNTSKLIINGTISLSPTVTDIKLRDTLLKNDIFGLETTNPPVDENLQLIKLTVVFFDILSSHYYSQIEFVPDPEVPSWSFEPEIINWDKAGIPDEVDHVDFFILIEFDSNTRIADLTPFLTTTLQFNYISTHPKYLDSKSSLLVDFVLHNDDEDQNKTNINNNINNNTINNTIKYLTAPKPIVLPSLPLNDPVNTSVKVLYQCNKATLPECTQFDSIFMTIPPLKSQMNGLVLSLFGLGHWFSPNKINLDGSNGGNEQEYDNGQQMYFKNEELYAASTALTINGEVVDVVVNIDPTAPQYATVTINDSFVFLPKLQYDIIITSISMVLGSKIKQEYQNDDGGQNQRDGEKGDGVGEHPVYNNDLSLPSSPGSNYIWLHISSTTGTKSDETIIGDNVEGATDLRATSIYDFVLLELVSVQDLPIITKTIYPFNFPLKTIIVQHQFKYPAIHYFNNALLKRDNDMVLDKNTSNMSNIDNISPQLRRLIQNQDNNDTKNAQIIGSDDEKLKMMNFDGQKEDLKDLTVMGFSDAIEVSIINANSTFTINRLNINVTATNGISLGGESFGPVNYYGDKNNNINEQYNNSHNNINSDFAAADDDDDDDDRYPTVRFPVFNLDLERYFALSLTFNVTYAISFVQANADSFTNMNNDSDIDELTQEQIAQLQIQFKLIRKKIQNVKDVDSLKNSLPNLRNHFQIQKSNQKQYTSTQQLIHNNMQQKNQLYDNESIFEYPYTTTLVSSLSIAEKTQVMTWSTKNQYNYEYKTNFSILFYDILQPCRDLTVAIPTANFQFVGNVDECYLSSGESSPDKTQELIPSSDLALIKDTYGKTTSLVMKPTDMTFTLGMAYNLTCTNLFITLYPSTLVDPLKEMSRSITISIQSTSSSINMDVDRYYNYYNHNNDDVDGDNNDKNNNDDFSESTTPAVSASLITFTISPPTPDPEPDPQPPKPQSIWIKILLWGSIGIILIAVFVVGFKLYERHNEYQKLSDERYKRRQARRAAKAQQQRLGSAGNTESCDNNVTLTFQQKQQLQRQEGIRLLQQRTDSSSNLSVMSSGYGTNANSGSGGGGGSGDSGGANNRVVGAMGVSRGYDDYYDHNMSDATTTYDDNLSSISGSNPYQQRPRSIKSPRGDDTVVIGDDNGNNIGNSDDDDEKDDNFIEWLFSSKTSFWNGTATHGDISSTKGYNMKNNNKFNNNNNGNNKFGVKTPPQNDTIVGLNPYNSASPTSPQDSIGYDNADASHPYSRANFYSTMSTASTDVGSSTPVKSEYSRYFYEQEREQQQQQQQQQQGQFQNNQYQPQNEQGIPPETPRSKLSFDGDIDGAISIDLADEKTDLFFGLDDDDGNDNNNNNTIVQSSKDNNNNNDNRFNLSKHTPQKNIAQRQYHTLTSTQSSDNFNSMHHRPQGQKQHEKQVQSMVNNTGGGPKDSIQNAQKFSTQQNTNNHGAAKKKPQQQYYATLSSFDLEADTVNNSSNNDNDNNKKSTKGKAGKGNKR